VAKKERLTEEIRYSAELVKVTWATLIAVVAGTLSVFAKNVPYQLALVIGIVVAIGLGMMTWRLHKKVETHISQLEEV
jgi:nicotinamide riboside transporter PnuC